MGPKSPASQGDDPQEAPTGGWLAAGTGRSHRLRCLGQRAHDQPGSGDTACRSDPEQLLKASESQDLPAREAPLSFLGPHLRPSSVLSSLPSFLSPHALKLSP